MSRFNYLFSFLFCVLSFTSLAQVRVLDEVFTNVNITKNVAYGENYTVLSGTPMLDTLKMDVYQPVGDTASRRPLIIFLHSGALLPKDLALPFGAKNDSSVIELCTQFAKRGFVAAAIDYRLGWNPFAANQETKASTYLNGIYRAMQDAKTAVRFFKKDFATGNTYKIDPNLVVLGGSEIGSDACLMAATLDKTSELMLPKFLTGLGNPMIDQSQVGGFSGDGGNPGLNVHNHPGYSDAFRMVLNLGGAIMDTSWMEAGDVPIASFHGIADPLTPYMTNIIIVSATGDPVIEVSGSFNVAKTANRLGNNNIWINANYNDAYSQVAESRTAYEGLFPFPGAANGFEPWAWYDATLTRIDNTTPGASGFGSPANPFATRAKAEMYIDTIMNYFAPRALEVFNDPNYVAPCVLFDTIYTYITDTVTFNDTVTVTVFDTVTINDTVTVPNFVTVYDTVTVAVSDTLLVDILTGLPSPNNINTIKIYPNPASDVVIIDNGNFSSMTNFTLKIINSLGQEVLSANMGIPQIQVPVSNIGAEGSYFVQIFDGNNTLVQTKVLILQ